MGADFPLLTWTVYFDYGCAPLIWQQEGHASSPSVGMMCLHASEMEDIVPAPMGAQFDALGCDFESSSDGQDIDWLTFHQEALRLSALLALWVAQFNILVRYSPPYEDGRFAAYDNEVWMDPGTVSRLARGMPSLEDDPASWGWLLALYGCEPIEELSMAKSVWPTQTAMAQGCAPS